MTARSSLAEEEFQSKLNVPSASAWRRLRDWTTCEVETAQVLTQMTGYCLLTGLTSAPIFSACYIWPGFQTGNFVQLSLAIARLFAGNSQEDTTFVIADRQALCSLICFLLGASLGQLGDRIGPKRRLWVVGSTFFQAFLVMAASLCAYFSHEPSVAQGRDEPVYRTVLGFCVIGFASASLGLHGIVAKRMERTEFGTAVVLTTVWVELASLPTLFSPRFSKGREHRLVAVGGLFLGGLFGGALVRQIGGAGTFGVVAGVRVASALSWCVAPAKKLTRGV